jgi:hypothetical protein
MSVDIVFGIGLPVEVAVEAPALGVEWCRLGVVWDTLGGYVPVPVSGNPATELFPIAPGRGIVVVVDAIVL